MINYRILKAKEIEEYKIQKKYNWFPFWFNFKVISSQPSADWEGGPYFPLVTATYSSIEDAHTEIQKRIRKDFDDKEKKWKVISIYDLQEILKYGRMNDEK